MNEIYTPKQHQFGNLSRYQSGLYTEMSALNFTATSVVLIDHCNNKMVIPPIPTSGARQDVISVLLRSCVGSSLSSDGQNIPINGMMITIEKYKLRNEPIFIKEINMLLCTEEQAINAKHPFSQITYSEGLEECVDRLADVIEDAPSFKILVNDPSNSYDRVWTILDYEVVEVPVTHYAGEDFVATILVTKNGKLYTQRLILNELNTGTTNIVKFADKVVPWITTSELNAKELAKSFKWITPETLEEYKAKLAQDNKKLNDQMKASNDAAIADYKTKLLNLETTLARTEAERDDYKYKYTNMKSDSQINLDQMKQRYAYMQMQNDMGVSERNFQMAGMKMQTAHQESQFKWVQLGLAAALPVLGLMAMKFFEKNLK